MEETKKRTKSQTSKLARRRGHQFERDCANELKVVFPNAKRHLEYQSQEAEKGFDIDGTFPYLFQCKRGRRYASINKIFEVKPSCSKEIPVLITQGDHCEPMVALSLSRFIEMLVKLKNEDPNIARPLENKSPNERAC